MMKDYQTKGMTQEQREKREREFAALIAQAELAEDHARATELKQARRRELRGRSNYPPERIGPAEVRIFDARGHKDAPVLLFDPAAPAEPLKCGLSTIVAPPSVANRWRS